MSTIGLALNSDILNLVRGRDFKWTFANLDENNQPVDYPDGDLFFEIPTGNEHNAAQLVTVTQAGNGTYKLGRDGEWTEPIDFDDVVDNPQDLSGDITDALVGLPSIGSRDNIKVSPASLYPVWQIDLALNRGVNEVQTLTLVGGPTGGYYTLTFRSQTTAHIAPTATAAQIQAALEALPAIGSGNVLVTGTAPTFTIAFRGALALTNVPQISPTAFTSPFGLGIFLFPTLTGGTNPSVKVVTTTEGSAPLTQQKVNVINQTLNQFFNAFEGLLGVEIDYTINTNYNMTFRVRSTHSFDESGLLTFAVDVTSDALVGAFNGVAGLLGLFNLIHVDFFWEHKYQIEFTGELGLQPQPALDVDSANLVGVNLLTPSVTVDIVRPGKARLTLWHFEIDGAYASIKVESAQADLIANRSPWQLVWLAAGEPAGGDPIAFGRVNVQAAL